MGSCISKCKPKTKNYPDNESSTRSHSHVQDKLVISQAPALSRTPPPPPRKLTLCPSPSPTYSSTSFSSFSNYASKNNSTELTSSLSSASSCSSSILCSKVDRSFSNEFLWSCAKENPQIISLEAIKDRVHQQKLESRTRQNVAPVKQSVPERLVRSTTQKRARANSPTLTRQKSFRVETVKSNSAYSRNLRSPSPSRRFNGDNYNRKGALSTYSTKESSCGSTRSVYSGRNKENIRPASPSNRFLSRDPSYLRNREVCSRKIGSQVDEVGKKEVESDDVLMEDIDNPLHIALDCFIFL